MRFSFKKGTHQHHLGKIGHFPGYYSGFSTTNNCCYLGEETVDENGDTRVTWDMWHRFPASWHTKTGGYLQHKYGVLHYDLRKIGDATNNFAWQNNTKPSWTMNWQKGSDPFNGKWVISGWNTSTMGSVPVSPSFPEQADNPPYSGLIDAVSNINGYEHKITTVIHTGAATEIPTAEEREEFLQVTLPNGIKTVIDDKTSGITEYAKKQAWVKMLLRVVGINGQTYGPITVKHEAPPDVTYTWFWKRYNLFLDRFDIGSEENTKFADTLTVPNSTVGLRTGGSSPFTATTNIHLVSPIIEPVVNLDTIHSVEALFCPLHNIGEKMSYIEGGQTYTIEMGPNHQHYYYDGGADSTTRSANINVVEIVNNQSKYANGAFPSGTLGADEWLLPGDVYSYGNGLVHLVGSDAVVVGAGGPPAPEPPPPEPSVEEMEEIDTWIETNKVEVDETKTVAENLTASRAVLKNMSKAKKEDGSVPEIAGKPIVMPKTQNDKIEVNATTLESVHKFKPAELGLPQISITKTLAPATDDGYGGTTEAETEVVEIIKEDTEIVLLEADGETTTPVEITVPNVVVYWPGGEGDSIKYKEGDVEYKVLIGDNNKHYYKTVEDGGVEFNHRVFVLSVGNGNSYDSATTGGALLPVGGYLLPGDVYKMTEDSSVTHFVGSDGAISDDNTAMRKFFVQLALCDDNGRELSTSASANGAWANGLTTNCAFERVVHLETGRKYYLKATSDTSGNQIRDMGFSVVSWDSV